MKALVWLLAVVGAGIVVHTIVVFALRDSELVIPPPEQVVKQFVRQLTSGRFELAKRSLANQTSEHTSELQLKFWIESLQSTHGKILKVKSERLWLKHNEVEAAVIAVIRTDSSLLWIPFGLCRQRGLWVIHQLDALETVAGMNSPALDPPANL